MKIFFLESSISFNSNDLNSETIGGTEKVLINIVNELAKNKSLNIKVFNKIKNKIIIKNVEWNNINNYDSRIIPDVIIAFSDVNLFKNYNAKKKFLWSHSVQNIEKFLRKRQLFAYLKHKPILILEGEYHYKNRPLLNSFFGKKILKLAPDYEFINEVVDIKILPEKNCIFTTKSDRNLKLLLDCWTKINEKNNDARLFINPPFNLKPEHVAKNIFLRKKGNKKDLINDLKASKIMLNPGHKGEVFCLAAEEARELCLPIVTLGYGSLYERVIHNKTGYIAKNLNEFVIYTNELLSNNDKYFEFRKNLLLLRNSRNYSHVANELLDIIKN